MRSYREHDFVVGARNKKLRQLGFAPGETVTKTTHIEAGKQTRTVETMRTNPDPSGRPYIKYERSLPPE